MDGLIGMANSISTSLTFKGDIPENHEDGTLPMLDFCTWLKTDHKGKTRIQHKFYEKPCASNMVLEERSAQPLRIKVNTLSQEVIRRLRNTA